jgi:hypothetical protein
VPSTHYLIALTRAHSGTTALWLLNVRDRLPYVPVPLLPPEADIVLNLPAALVAIYEEAGYDLSIDYSQPPPPPDFSPDDQH